MHPVLNHKGKAKEESWKIKLRDLGQIWSQKLASYLSFSDQQGHEKRSKGRSKRSHILLVEFWLKWIVASGNRSYHFSWFIYFPQYLTNYQSIWFLLIRSFDSLCVPCSGKLKLLAKLFNLQQLSWTSRLSSSHKTTQKFPIPKQPTPFDLRLCLSLSKDFKCNSTTSC